MDYSIEYMAAFDAVRRQIIETLREEALAYCIKNSHNHNATIVNEFLPRAEERIIKLTPNNVTERYNYENQFSKL